MGYPTIPSICRRELQSTRYLSLNFRVGVMPHSTLRTFFHTSGTTVSVLSQVFER